MEKNAMLCVENSLINIHFGTKAIVGGIPLSRRMKKNITCILVIFFILEFFIEALFLKTKLIIDTDKK